MGQMPFSPGTKVGRYEIRSKIGEGGMGEVYRARDEKLNRDVAIKVLPTSFADNHDRLQRFEQEAQAAGTLSHPNILAVFDLGTHEGAPYVVSELLEGQSFRDLLAHHRPSTRKQSTTPYKSRMVWLLLTKKASFIETSNPTIYLLQMMSA